MTDLPPIERLVATELAPGDFVIATLPVGTSDTVADRLKNALSQMFPGQEVLVCVGFELDAMRPVAAHGPHQ